MQISVTNWKKYNGRADVKFPSWFRIDYKMSLSPKIWGLDGDEYKAWISILSLCCMHNSDKIEIDPDHFCRIYNVKMSGLDGVIKKLQGDQILIEGVTDTLRERNEDVTGTIRDRQTDKQTNTRERNPDAARPDIDRFQKIWDKLPHRPKDPRTPAFNKLAKLSEHELCQVEVAAINYKRFIQTNPPSEMKFIPATIVWLNQRRWEDYLTSNQPSKTRKLWDGELKQVIEVTDE